MPQPQETSDPDQDRTPARARRWWHGFVLVSTLLLSVSCMGDREEVRAAVPAEADAQGTEATMPPEALGDALSSFLERMVDRIDLASQAIIARNGSNDHRRNALHWRLRTEEAVMSAMRHKNSLLSLMDCWSWVIGMERYYTEGEGKALFHDEQGILTAAVVQISSEADQLVAAVVGGETMTTLRKEIVQALGSNNQFTATNAEHASLMGKMFSATRMESIWGVAMSPFDALAGVGKGADAMDDLVKTADRAVSLAERYPRLLAIQFEMMAIDLQEQEAPQTVIQELNRAITLAEALPTRVREETQILLNDTVAVQAEARATLSEVRQAADALERAGEQTTAAIQALDAFLVNAKGPPDPPGTPPGEPFRIQEYTAALEAATRMTQEAQKTMAELQRTLESPELQRHLAQVKAEFDDSLGKVRMQVTEIQASVNQDVTALVNRLGAIIAGLLVLSAVLGGGLLVFARRAGRR